MKKTLIGGLAAAAIVLVILANTHNVPDKKVTQSAAGPQPIPSETEAKPAHVQVEFAPRFE